MEQNELNFLKGIAKQLQDFIEEREKPYYLVVTFEGRQRREKPYSKIWVYDEYCWCEGDNVNGGPKTMYFHTKEEACKYGEELKENHWRAIHSYRVLTEEEKCSGDFMVYWD